MNLLQQIADYMGQKFNELKALIDTNTADISSNDTDIADHESRITSNEADLVDHESRISTNESSLASVGRMKKSSGTASDLSGSYYEFARVTPPTGSKLFSFDAYVIDDTQNWMKRMTLTVKTSLNKIYIEHMHEASQVGGIKVQKTSGGTYIFSLKITFSGTSDITVVLISQANIAPENMETKMLVATSDGPHPSSEVYEDGAGDDMGFVIMTLGAGNALGWGLSGGSLKATTILKGSSAVATLTEAQAAADAAEAAAKGYADDMTLEKVGSNVYLKKQGGTIIGTVSVFDGDYDSLSNKPDTNSLDSRLSTLESQVSTLEGEVENIQSIR